MGVPRVQSWHVLPLGFLRLSLVHHSHLSNGGYNICPSETFLFIYIAAYGGSQARGQIRTTAEDLTPQQCLIQAASVTYATAYGNSGSLTH